MTMVQVGAYDMVKCFYHDVLYCTTLHHIIHAHKHIHIPECVMYHVCMSLIIYI